MSDPDLCGLAGKFTFPGMFPDSSALTAPGANGANLPGLELELLLNSSPPLLFWLSACSVIERRTVSAVESSSVAIPSVCRNPTVSTRSTIPLPSISSTRNTSCRISASVLSSGHMCLCGCQLFFTRTFSSDEVVPFFSSGGANCLSEVASAPESCTLPGILPNSACPGPPSSGSFSFPGLCTGSSSP